MVVQGLVGEQHTDIRMMLVVKETPEDYYQSISNRNSSIEWQLGYLCSRKLSECIAELDDGIIFIGGVFLGKHAVVTRLLDIVLDRLGVLQMHRLAEDQALGLLGRVLIQDIISNVLLITEAGFDEGRVTDSDFLRGIIARVDPNQILVFPLEDDKADNGVIFALVGEELHQYKWIDRTPPC